MTSMAESLPTECLSLVISFTSPRDACRSSLVSRAFRDAANSDVVWDKFVPSDYPEIISDDLVSKVSSKKELFRMLSSTPILIHGDKKVSDSLTKILQINLRSFKIIYILPSSSCMCFLIELFVDYILLFVFRKRLKRTLQKAWTLSCTVLHFIRVSMSKRNENLSMGQRKKYILVLYTLKVKIKLKLKNILFLFCPV